MLWKGPLPLLEGAADWLFPPHCVSCGQEGSLLCEPCLGKARRLRQPACRYCGEQVRLPGVCKRCAGKTWHYEGVSQYAIYDGPIAKAVRAIKYDHNLFLAHHLTGLLVEALRTSGFQVDLVTAVPLSPRHQRARGYNQAALLAQPLAAQLGLLYAGKAIARVRETASQVTLSIAERQANVAGAFKGKPDQVSRKAVLIVDDVFTTGATLNECALALKEAGAEKVYGLTLAKALHSLEDTGLA